uniref:V-SNARE coiled-coil homology domain-containing protein n=1 Tax=Oryzias sinensis TaxID=183150 RepID=A0A8C7WUP8_9TELE
DQVDGVKNIMTENVDRILARGERLDDLMDKTEDLQMGSHSLFHYRTLKVLPCIDEAKKQRICRVSNSRQQMGVSRLV